MAEPALQTAPLPGPPGAEVEWLLSRWPVPYPQAVATMTARARAIAEDAAPECVWLLEHPALYTAGTSAPLDELLEPNRFPVFASGRGGRFTYHGPGQRVIYAMLDLSARGRDLHAFVHALEDWLVAALARLGVVANHQPGAVGIFVGEEKIASIGVRVRRWVSFHGASLNVAPNLAHFSGIVPCGLTATPATSLAALGAETDMAKVDAALRTTFADAFADALPRMTSARS